MPVWFAVVVALPSVWLVAMALAPGTRGRLARLAMYVWFLVALVLLVPLEWNTEYLRTALGPSTPLPEAIATAFFGAGVLLFFAGNLFQLLMLAPAPRRRHLVWDIVLGGGREDTVSRRTAAAMVRRVDAGRVTGWAPWTLLAGHAALLVLLPRVAPINGPLAAAVSVVVVSWGLEAGRPRPAA
jgi:hypothetical protein